MIILSDIHGEMDNFFNCMEAYPDEFINEKYIIQLGDFGFIFAETQSVAEELLLDNINIVLESNNKTLFTILGNHDCWPRYLQMETNTDWGFRSWKLRSHIYAVVPGEIIALEGKTFLCIGGAESHDLKWRIQYAKDFNQNIWWPEESITDTDMENAYRNLKWYDNKVDYICTHCEPHTFMVKSQVVRNTIPAPSELKLDKLLSIVDFKKWYGGHVHTTYEIETGGKSIKSLNINHYEII